MSADSIGLDSIRDPLADRLSDQDQQERGKEGLNLAAEMEIWGPEFGSEDPIVNLDANGEEGRDGTISKGRSIAHTICNNQQSVFLSFDIKTAGEIAGIVQISAEILRFKINLANKTVGSDYADDIERVADTFNSYVNPEVLPECEACVKLSADKTPYYLQCTTWKDKQQVSFLSNNKVGWSDGMTVQRCVRGKSMRDTIAAPRAQADYVANYNAVDRNDRDSEDYSTTIRTNQYYLRIFCWALDGVIHAANVVVCFLIKSDIGQKE